MKVPMLDLRAQLLAVEPELRSAVDAVITSGIFILGPEATALESEIAALSRTRHGIGVSNGSDALVAALLALDIGEGDEVIVPTFTFFATAGSVSRVGGKPVFVDIQPDTFNICPDAVAAAITPRTRAIIPVHLYGQCADMAPILDLARRHHLAVIEDAAQAIGASRDGTPAGSFGDAGTLSFYPTKNLSAIGEAGMVLTGSDDLAEKLRIIRDHGMKPQYHHHRIGANFRLDAIQAAALRVKLKRLQGWNDARRARAARYDAAFQSTDVVAPPVRPGCHHVYHQYTVRVDQRDALRAALTESGVASGIYYPIPLHLQPCFADLGGSPGQFPAAERACAEVLSLPIFPEMTEQQQDHVIASILRFYH